MQPPGDGGYVAYGVVAGTDGGSMLPRPKLGRGAAAAAVFGAATAATRRRVAVDLAASARVELTMAAALAIISFVPYVR